MAHWLIKTEPTSYSIDDLARDGRTDWTGVRNYQARNNLRAMAVGDLLIVYHSNAEPSGAVGTAKVVATAKPDRTQFLKRDSHYDPKSDPEDPTWVCPDVAFASRFSRLVPLSELNADPALDGMMLRAPQGSRLSVQPLSKEHYDHVVRLGRKAAPAEAPKATKKAKGR